MKNRILVLLTLLISIFVFAGCSSKHMDIITEDMATITFYRYSSFGGSIQAPIAELTNNGLKFVGILSVDTKIRKVVTSGKHKYVVGGESGHLLEAKFIAGKHYYVEIEPKAGTWKANFKFLPISPKELETEKIRERIKATNYISINESGKQWFIRNKSSLSQKAIDRNAEQTEHKEKQELSNYMPNVELNDKIEKTTILNPTFGIDKELE